MRRDPDAPAHRAPAAREPRRAEAPRCRSREDRVKTFFEKVWNDHVIAELGDDTALLQIDRLFLHDMSGSAAMKSLEKSGRTPASPRQVYTVIDHVVSTRPGRGRNETRAN